SNALTDLGESISVMPFSMFKRLGIGNLKPVNMVIEMADRSMQSPKGIAENVLVPIILERPMLATAHARIDVFGGKISLEVGTEQIIFNTNEGTSPSTVSPVYQNDLLPNLDALEDISLSQCKSPGYNGDTPREFQGSDNNMGIEIDDLIEGMDDLWDDLDPRVLMNNIDDPPLKLEFFSVGNRVHRRNPYNLQITCKIGFVNFNPYIDPHSPFNIMSRAAYNSVMKQELIYTGNNIVGMTHSWNDNKPACVHRMSHPFKEKVGLEEDITMGVLWFKIENDKTIFNMPHAEKRLCKLTTEQHNMMSPILKVSDEDKANEVLSEGNEIRGYFDPYSCGNNVRFGRNHTSYALTD
ncbi:hypothetical protein Tco_1481596, partial [Tanacetum coccineum]